MYQDPLSSLPKKIRIVEVGPRDGLQNEASKIPTEAKIRFIRDLALAGVRDIEATSFVHPKAVPQLADASEVLAGLENLPKDTILSTLVPNSKGLDRAMKAGVKRIAVFTAASETFNQRNIRCGIEESFERFRSVMEKALDAGMQVRGYVSTVFGCPYEGEVDAELAREVTMKLLDMGCFEVSLGDTIGVATPSLVRKTMEVILETVPVEKVALHFHDTRGTALANVMTGLGLGVTTYDSSAGGLGGCPYAPGAAGNLASEDLVYLLNGLGIDTGIKIDELAGAALRLEESLDHELPGRTVATYRKRFHNQATRRF